MDIPNSLIEQVREGQALLFLGAGAALGAIHPDGKSVPLAKDLARLLANKFLTEDYETYTLDRITELAISEHNLFDVQEFIADLFYKFGPSEAHSLIPTFTWKAIATTNYDLIIERAYDQVTDKAQILVPFTKNGEPIETKIVSARDLMYLKLHGSITSVNDKDLPLILTVEQYVSHRQNRSRLFDRLKQFAYDVPILFVGYGLADQNIRSIMMELNELGDAKPRSYLVDPTIKPEEARLWESKKITSISLSFDEFIRALNDKISPAFRALAPSTSDLSPIERRFSTTEVSPSFSLRTLLNRDVDFLHVGFKTGSIDPQSFYKGYFEGWTAIEMQLDSRRRISDAILSEVFLVDEEEKLEKQEVIVIRGHAGSGKSVILKRIAWDAAVAFDKLCLFVKPSARPSYEPISELFTLCKERIYLFIEPTSDYVELIESFITRAKKEKLPLTIITASRLNTWHMYCDGLDSIVTTFHELKYLNENEIGDLLQLLDKHKCLGHLAELSTEEQKRSLAEKAGRQLLVALHEATLGKPFQDIVLDEFNTLPTVEAQNLYLSVCVLHRLGVVTRAGVISRLHGISFEEFQKRLFKPLDNVVFAQKHPILNDFQYVTRHPQIAEMVFEQVLINAEDRHLQYSRMLNSLDIDYNADRDAFRAMTNAKHLRRLFSSSDQVRKLYSIAESAALKDAQLLQQRAIFEMGVPDGDLDLASSFLLKARNLSPRSKPIAHSLAELNLKRAERTTNELERKRLRDESRKLAQGLITHDDRTSHPYHTIIKSLLIELEEALDNGTDSFAVEKMTKELSQQLAIALQEFSDDAFMLEADSKFNSLIKNSEHALSSLKKAFQSDKKSSYIALRLSNMYIESGETQQAITTLREALEFNSSEKDLNFKLGMVLQKQPGASQNEVKHLLRNSFTKGDSRFMAQFWYARQLYIEGEIADAKGIFQNLANSDADSYTKRKIRGAVRKDGESVVFRGAVIKLEESYAFIKRDGIGDGIYVNRHSEETCGPQFVWEEMETNKRVSFNLAFRYLGPIAFNIRDEIGRRF